MSKTLISTGQPIITDMKKIDNKTVLGDGFKVVVLNIHTTRYEDSDCVVEIEIEGGIKGNKVNWLVYINSFKIMQVFDSALGQVNKKEVLKRIGDALTLLDMPHCMI